MKKGLILVLLVLAGMSAVGAQERVFLGELEVNFRAERDTLRGQAP